MTLGEVMAVASAGVVVYAEIYVKNKKLTMTDYISDIKGLEDAPVSKVGADGSNLKVYIAFEADLKKK